MTHVVDDLELYALGALPEEHATGVARHLTGCASCRAAAAELSEVVARLPDAIPLREPPPRLKARILAAAREAPRQRPFGVAFSLPDVRALAVAAALLLLLSVDVVQTRQLQAMQAERDALQVEKAGYEAIAVDLAHGGRTWYMAGVDQWRGMGGNLVQPGSGDAAFVVFHDLPTLDGGRLYALWLISPDGKWVRGTTFRAEGRDLQMVALGQDLAGYERCAVTIETSPSGKREGPIVMQSRIAPPAQ